MKLADLHESLFDKGYISILGHMGEPDEADMFWVFLKKEKRQAEVLAHKFMMADYQDVSIAVMSTLNGFHIVAVTPNYKLEPDEGDFFIAFAPTEKSCLDITNDLAKRGKIKGFESFDDVFIVPIKIASEADIAPTITWLKNESN